MARFFMPQNKIRDGRGRIDGPELEHLRRVLRFAPGDRVTLFDGTGIEHEGLIHSINSQRADIEIVRSYPADRESKLDLTLGVGLTKGEKTDFVIEKATELGVQTILPFASEFTVPKLNETKIDQRMERWKKIALGAAKQCGRTQVPVLRRLCSFGELVGQSWPSMLKLLLWETGERRTLKQVYESAPDTRSAILLIGPEGGFSQDEASLAQRHGFLPVQLGRRTLRSETAALAALSLVQYLWGDLG